MDTRTLGDYAIIKQIGRGSLGTVFLGEHRFMKRQYALKVLSEDLASDRNFVQRFEEEVARLATLEHPHIVKIHNVSYAQGVYFLVTDCIVDGMNETTNLAQYLATHRAAIPEEEVLSLLRQIADALDYAHGKGQGSIIHRGLKLNNILVGKAKQGIELYTSDFGLSKILGIGNVLSRIYRNLADALGFTEEGLPRRGAEPPESSRLATLHNTFLQSYAFLAPEQKRISESRNVDVKADVYAFGVLAYVLLTRQFPEGLFTMPSEIRRESKYNWDVLIRACMASDPEKRPLYLLDALDEVESPEEETASPQTAWGSAPPPDWHSHQKGENAAVASPPTPDQYAVQTPKPMAQPYIPTSTPEPIVASLSPEGAVSAAASVRPVGMSAQPEPPALHEASSQPNSPSLYHEFQTPSNTRPLVRPMQSAHPVQLQESSPPHISSLPAAPQAAAIPTPEQNPVLQAMRSDSTVTAYQPERKEVRHIEPIPTDRVRIEGGTFFRGRNDGNRDEMPRHQVHLRPFAIDVHPVTNQQFVLFLEYMRGEKDEQNHDMIILKESRIKRSAGKLTIESGYAKHPVVGVTWYGAVAYAKWVGKRLPTEAEWEVAAFGGEEEATYPTGGAIEKNQANFFSSDTTAVMSYPPNGFGLFDMAGNVYEWCADWYGYNYYEASAQEPDDPRGPMQGVYRVLRGGCWKSLVEDLRCSHRHRNNPGTVNGTYGFRCASDVE